MGYEKLARGMSSQEAARKLQRGNALNERSKDFHGASPPSVFIGSQLSEGQHWCALASTSGQLRSYGFAG